MTARHSVQQYTRQVGGALGVTALGIFVPAARPFGDVAGAGLGVLFLKYGRDDERQSDSLGARYASTIGYDPAGVPAFLSTIGRLDEAAGERKGVPNFLSTHPDPLSRMAEIQPLVRELKAGRTSLAINRDGFMRRLDGVIYGDSPAQGLVRGSAFLHPVLRFGLDFPTNWAIANSASQVVARAPDRDAFMLLQRVQKPQGRTVQDIAIDSMTRAGFRAVEGQRTTINGLDAFIGVYRGQIEGLGDVVMRAAHIAYASNIYMVGGLVPPEAFNDKTDRTFTGSIRSFRTLSASEAETIRPHRIELHTVRAGDTWESLAGRSGDAVKAATLAVMNNAAPGAQPQPQPGTRIKIVGGG